MYYLTDGSARAFPMTMQTDLYGNLLQPWYYNAAAGLGAFILDSPQSNLVGVEEDGKHGPLVNTTAAGPIDVHDWHHYGLSFDPGPPGTANFTIDGALVSSWTALRLGLDFADVTAAELGGAWMHLGVYTIGPRAAEADRRLPRRPRRRATVDARALARRARRRPRGYRAGGRRALVRDERGRRRHRRQRRLGGRGVQPAPRPERPRRLLLRRAGRHRA